MEMLPALSQTPQGETLPWVAPPYLEWMRMRRWTEPGGEVIRSQEVVACRNSWVPLHMLGLGWMVQVKMMKQKK